jgi:hypothetical protein
MSLIEIVKGHPSFSSIDEESEIASSLGMPPTAASSSIPTF